MSTDPIENPRAHSPACEDAVSDQGTRELHRKALTDPASRAALLRARMRAGEVSKANVEVAACLGLAEARAVVPNCFCWSGSRRTKNYHLWGSCSLLTTGKQAAWNNGLLPLLNNLVGPTLVVTCGECGGTGTDNIRSFIDEAGFVHQYECPSCEGGQRALFPHPQQYYAVLIGHAVGRKYHQSGRASCTMLPCMLCDTLKAVGSWLKGQTEGRYHRIRILTNQRLGRPGSIYQPLRMAYSWDGAARTGFGVGLRDATRVLGRDAVCGTALEALRPYLGL